MYGAMETILWFSVAIPFLGFAWCALIEHNGEQGFLKSPARFGIIAGWLASCAHLAQAIGLNLSMTMDSPEIMGLLCLLAPLAGIWFALASAICIRRHGDHEVRGAGVTSAAVAGGSMALLILASLVAGVG
jgi:hypothetical protein